MQMEEWVTSHWSTLPSELSRLLPDVARSFLQSSPVHALPSLFIPNDSLFDLRERDVVDVEMVAGFPHRVCFLSARSIERNNSFLNEILAGPRVFASFFHQDTRGVLCLSARAGTVVVLVGAGERPPPAAEHFFESLEAIPVGVPPEERKAAESMGVRLRSMSELDPVFFTKAIALRESIQRQSPYIRAKDLREFCPRAGITKLQSAIFFGYANRSFLAFFFDEVGPPARAKDDAEALGNELRFGVPYWTQENRERPKFVPETRVAPAALDGEVDKEVREWLQGTAFGFDEGDAEVVMIDITDVVAPPKRQIVVDEQFWSGIRDVEQAALRNGLTECNGLQRRCIKCDLAFPNPVLFMRHLYEWHRDVQENNNECAF
jgi:hypothetical protein